MPEEFHHGDDVHHHGDYNDCIDDNTDCAYWATSGECELNPGYMLESCKLSCDACDLHQHEVYLQDPVFVCGSCSVIDHPECLATMLYSCFQKQRAREWAGKPENQRHIPREHYPNFFNLDEHHDSDDNDPTPKRRLAEDPELGVCAAGGTLDKDWAFNPCRHDKKWCAEDLKRCWDDSWANDDPGAYAQFHENCGCTCGDAQTMMALLEEDPYDYCEFLDQMEIDATGFVTQAQAAVYQKLSGQCLDSPETNEQAWDIINRVVSKFEDDTPRFPYAKDAFEGWHEGTCPYFDEHSDFDEDFHGVCAEGVPEMICKGERCRTDADCGPSTISGQVVCYTGSDAQADYWWDWDATDTYLSGVTDHHLHDECDHAMFDFEQYQQPDHHECTCEAPWPCYHPDNVANGNTPCMGSGHMDDYSDEWWIEEDYQIWMPNQDMVNEWCLKNMGPEHVGCGQESIIGLPIEHQEQPEHEQEHEHHEPEHDESELSLLGPLEEYGQGVLLITHVNTQDDADKALGMRHRVGDHVTGLVCHRYFSDRDADVACRQLGYARHKSYTYVDKMAENLIHHHDDHHLAAHTDSEMRFDPNGIDYRPLICDRCGNYENFFYKSWRGEVPIPTARGREGFLLGGGDDGLR
jgi:hypothetical protein